jgi:hypothetical protein
LTGLFTHPFFVGQHGVVLGHMRATHGTLNDFFGRIFAVGVCVTRGLFCLMYFEQRKKTFAHYIQ